MVIEPIRDKFGKLVAVCLSRNEEIWLNFELDPFSFFRLQLMMHGHSFESITLTRLLILDFTNLPLTSIPYPPHKFNPFRPRLLFFHKTLLQCIGIGYIYYNLIVPLGSVSAYKSPFIIDSSAFELANSWNTVIVLYPRLALSLSSRLTNSCSVTLFFNWLFLAALMIEFSIPIAFSGFTVLIFMTMLAREYVCLWLRGWGAV